MTAYSVGKVRLLGLSAHASEAKWKDSLKGNWDRQCCISCSSDMQNLEPVQVLDARGKAWVLLVHDLLKPRTQGPGE